MDPPAGITIRDGQYFNPYFPGGALAMGRALYNETVEYDDGTPPTASQHAKDVCTFLRWCGEPEWDDRRIMLLRVMMVGALFLLCLYPYHASIQVSFKTRKLQMIPFLRRKH